MHVALHRGLSLSHSRRVTRFVMYSGEGIRDERDHFSFYSGCRQLRRSWTMEEKYGAFYKLLSHGFDDYGSMTNEDHSPFLLPVVTLLHSVGW